MEFSHVDKEGKAVMVDVSAKPKIKRTASAEGRILMTKETVHMIQDNLIKKGDVLTVAKIAGITGGKRTSDLIPLCHNIEIDQINLTLECEANAVKITSFTTCIDKTGIEMEALTAVSIAALTIYDMCKAVDKRMVIQHIHLLEKTKEAV